jgi:hypothetical protein
VTRAEERHKLVTASLNFYKTAEQVSLTHRLFFCYLWTCDLYGLVRNVYDACRSITRARGKGFGPWKSRLFWTLKWQRAKRVPFRPKKAQCSKLFLPHCPPTRTPLPHLSTALNSTQSSELESQNLIQINRKLTYIKERFGT